MKMICLTSYENLSGFASSRPPLVIFMVCMGLFAIVLLSLAYYVKWNEIQNPDISQVRIFEDWIGCMCVRNIPRLLPLGLTLCNTSFRLCRTPTLDRGFTKPNGLLKDGLKLKVKILHYTKIGIYFSKGRQKSRSEFYKLYL